MSERPWMKWYWSDWSGDRALRSCSLAARGLWAEMLGIMDQADPRGSLVISGLPVTLRDLSLSVGADLKLVSALFSELKLKNVFSIDDAGIVYSRRMRRDSTKSLIAREKGLKGGNPALKAKDKPTGYAGGLSGKDKPNDNGLKPQDKLYARARTRVQNPDREESSSSKATIEKIGPSTLERQCRDLLRDDPVIVDVNFAPIAELVDGKTITEADVIAGIEAAIATPGFRVKFWGQLVGWVKTAAKNRIAATPRPGSPTGADHATPRAKGPANPNNEPVVEFVGDLAVPISTCAKWLEQFANNCDDWFFPTIAGDMRDLPAEIIPVLLAGKKKHGPHVLQFPAPSLVKAMG